jgi:EAL domain-containing protein (putative c-di-GMP-specific phosphodiesterase class I)
MYAAKHGGKHRYALYTPELTAAAERRLSLEHDLREAIEKHQFVLVYQPQVSLQTGRMTGVEALIRWHHPQSGLLFPDSFLPEIQNHPLDIEIGEWVIRSALRQLEAWRAVGLDLTVSVNLSAHQLEQSDFTARLHAILEEFPEVPAAKLVIEILETGALENLTQMVRIIEDCGQLGVSFALDDFGTGYASLAHLKALPVAKIKVDRDFVRNMQDNPDDLSIVEGIAGLAAAFRRSLIAEGVETSEHGRMLLQLGCELAQGYAIARPMPQEQVPAWITFWQPDLTWMGQRTLLPGERPLLFAITEHRSWMVQLERALKQKDGVPYPEIDWHECRFGKWLDNEGELVHGGDPVFIEIGKTHENLHQTAVEVLQLHGGGQPDLAWARFGECLEMQRRLEELLAQLVNHS